MALSDGNTIKVEDLASTFKANVERIDEALYGLNYIKKYFENWSAETVIGADVMSNYVVLTNALTSYVSYATSTYNQISGYVTVQQRINAIND